MKGEAEGGTIADWLHRHAAKFIGLAVALAFAAFAIGAWDKAIRDVAFKGAELCVWGAGLFSVLLIRRQLWHQEKQAERTMKQLVADHEWRTYAFYHQHFNELPTESCKKEVYALAERHGFLANFRDRGTALSRETAEALLHDKEQMDPLRYYLDSFESFCGSINAKLLDEDYAYALQGTRVVRNHAVFFPLIERWQAGAPTAYVELCKVAVRWSIRMRIAEAGSVSEVGIGAPNGASGISGPT